MRTIYIILLFLLTSTLASTQVGEEITQQTLQATIQWAQEASIAARRAATLQTTRYWEFRSFQANYKPQVQLNGVLPGFTRSFQEVIQQDGTIRFLSVSNNNANVGLSISQPIALTGGTLFVGTSLQRFDNFKEKQTFFNGAPVEIGIEQPLFAYNSLKWDKKIAPLRYRESQQDYIGNMEEIALNTVDFFFNLLVAQTNFQIAETNLANTDTIYQITLERQALGKASRNDVLQLRLETLKAKKAQATAEQDLAAARQQLSAYIGKQMGEDLRLDLPEIIPDIIIESTRAIQETMTNRPDAIGFLRRALEAQAAVAAAKGQNGFSAALVGGFGMSGSGERLGQVYSEAQDKESLFLRFNIPILDWGRSKSQLETAKAQQKLTTFEVEQDRINLEQEVLTQVNLLDMFRQQVLLNKEADEVAAARYQIAQERFILGNLSITDLSIALQENVQAKRDYIQSLWDFWRTHHSIRVLTLFDFEKQQKINY
ncbi:MAG: TolC family protein [Saprospiraceae bacterium]